MRAARTDPRVVRSRAAVLEAATRLFLRSGFAGTSMDEIAEAAGLSKRTLYNNFAHKEDLFREVVSASITLAERFAYHAAAELEDPDDLGAALTGLARRLAREVTGPPVVRLRRLLIGEAHRFPDLAADYYEQAPGRVMSTIATAFGRLAARGRLRVDDPVRAAEQFAFLVLGPALDRALFSGQDVPPDPDLLARAADDGVRTFLTAYG
jgi:TetR/AcrR family transcriptional regulator, mexJK operon transcriptional repressor